MRLVACLVLLGALCGTSGEETWTEMSGPGTPSSMVESFVDSTSVRGNIDSHAERKSSVEELMVDDHPESSVNNNQRKEAPHETSLLLEDGLKPTALVDTGARSRFLFKKKKAGGRRRRKGMLGSRRRRRKGLFGSRRRRRRKGLFGSRRRRRRRKGMLGKMAMGAGALAVGGGGAYMAHSAMSRRKSFLGGIASKIAGNPDTMRKLAMGAGAAGVLGAGAMAMSHRGGSRGGYGGGGYGGGGYDRGGYGGRRRKSWSMFGRRRRGRGGESMSGMSLRPSAYMRQRSDVWSGLFGSRRRAVSRRMRQARSPTQSRQTGIIMRH